LRYRKNLKSLPGTPDVVFLRAKVAVFCDGDFWHGRDWSRRKALLARGTNPAYWIAKIEGNMARDRRIDDTLKASGWTVLRYWESELRHRVDLAVDSVRAAVSLGNRKTSTRE